MANFTTVTVLVNTTVKIEEGTGIHDSTHESIGMEHILLTLVVEPS